MGTELGLDVSGNGTQETRPDVVLLDMDSLSDERAVSLASDCHELGLPTIAVMSSEHLTSYDPSLDLDDFILYPFSSEELMARLSQAIFRTKGPQEKHVLRAGDLNIDMERYEVRLSGRRIVLTYKEYQLLALLAANPGRVYSRDGLLNQVWGYDYFGGTRTVDVHIRRLRSKIEDADHSFIETIWNVGYRFKAAL
ncbi:MAG: response regulator transcription factor [Dehalococcoidia bacterium]|nr:response regulator transcription factor [Dehalococcoidia bacterium]